MITVSHVPQAKTAAVSTKKSTLGPSKAAVAVLEVTVPSGPDASDVLSFLDSTAPHQTNHFQSFNLVTMAIILFSKNARGRQIHAPLFSHVRMVNEHALAEATNCALKMTPNATQGWHAARAARCITWKMASVISALILPRQLQFLLSWPFLSALWQF